MINVKHRIEALDGLRFFAFFMVMFYHYLFIAPLQGFIPKDLAIKAFSFGDFGVDLFFLISGFVITLSSENRSALQFFIARFNRIVPLFIVCALVIYFFSISLPMVDPRERIVSLMYSLTFFPQLFGKQFFSSVYWTIAVEVTFYLWVTALIVFNVWNRYRLLICFIWIALSYLNSFILMNSFLTNFFITQYAGHFVIGIVLFELRMSKIKPLHAFLILISSVLVFNNMLDHQKWIDSFNVHIESSALLFTTFFLISLVWIASHVETMGSYYSIVKFLGAMTYPLYLIHADLGFWSHAIFERKWWGQSEFLKEHVGYHSMALIACVLSFLIAALLVKFVDPILQKYIKKVWAIIVPSKKTTNPTRI
ncbi:acyltransferase family protein [Candidatus Pantoea formicae]|uniref:acyltransferase family protein n=1 Tax=Candidatus Pantoea formicae TaxID=2608355 RepID=UPI003ED9FDFC